MKSFLLFSFLLFIFLFTSCEKDKELVTPLSGTWQLIEVLADPGDGSGTFESVTSGKTITFGEAGAYTANGDLCNFSEESATTSSGIFWDEDQNVEPGGCISQAPRSGITYEFVDEELILSYPCIEPCRHKFSKQ